MRLRTLLPLALLAFALLAVPAAGSKTAPAPARPVLLGFEDESGFMWSADRFANLDRAAAAHASVIRITANWAELAPTRPASPASPDDHAYRFNGLDDLVYQASLRNANVLLTIWGTPKWASATHKPNAAPKPSDLTAFCTAIGERYNGVGPVAPVRLFSVWNEPNLDQFLHPQFAANGADVAPKLYAGMARACYAAIKRVNPTAQVALGETSPRGHDKPVKGSQASHSPGRFAQLVGAVRPRVPFDAWAHHPYADGFLGNPDSHFRWPNVGIADLPQLELALRKDFGRKSVPLWITEFAYQTRPEHPGALSYSRQASYLSRAVQSALDVADVRMFVWYVFRDTPGARWQSGVVTGAGGLKPSFFAFAKVASRYDVANPTLTIPAGPPPRLTLSALDFKARSLPTDPSLGVNYRVTDSHGGLTVVGQAQARPNDFGQIALTLQFVPKAKTTYTVALDLNDVHGNTAHRTAHLIVR